MSIESLRAAEARANQAVHDAAAAVEALTDESDGDDVIAAATAFDEARDAATAAREARIRFEAVQDAREAFPVIDQTPPAQTTAGAASVDVRGKQDEPTYRPDAPHSFFRDIRLSRNGDTAAAERLRRNQAEGVDRLAREGRRHELRDVTTGSGEGAGFIPPNYLASLFIDVRRERRPTVDIFPKLPLPSTGMTLTIPRLLTGAKVDVQNPEGTALAEQDITSDQLTVNIRTVGGIQDMTVQLWERSEPGMDQLIMAELVALYDQRLDMQVIAGTGSNGQLPGLRAVSSTNAVTYTDGTPTGRELLVKIYDAIQQIRSNYMARASHILMHPRRAAWLAASSDTNVPIFQQGGFSTAVGAQNVGAVGSMAGLPVIEDANIGTGYGASTDEDEVYVVAADASPIAEGMLRFDVHDQPLGDQLKVRARVFNYVGFASERYPKSISKITGTGLKIPTF